MCLLIFKKSLQLPKHKPLKGGKRVMNDLRKKLVIIYTAKSDLISTIKYNM